MPEKRSAVEEYVYAMKQRSDPDVTRFAGSVFRCDFFSGRLLYKFFRPVVKIVSLLFQ